jgi:hypothetical protein
MGDRKAPRPPDPRQVKLPPPAPPRPVYAVAVCVICHGALGRLVTPKGLSMALCPVCGTPSGLVRCR